MPARPISQLPVATPLTGLEVLPVVQGGRTVQVSLNTLAAFSTLTALRASLPTTKPATPGLLWLNGGSFAVS